MASTFDTPPPTESSPLSTPNPFTMANPLSAKGTKSTNDVCAKCGASNVITVDMLNPLEDVVCRDCFHEELVRMRERYDKERRSKEEDDSDEEDDFVEADKENIKAVERKVKEKEKPEDNETNGNTCSNCNTSTCKELFDIGDSIKMCVTCYERFGGRPSKIGPSTKKQVSEFVESRVCSNCTATEENIGTASNLKWRKREDGTYLCWNCHHYRVHHGEDRPLKLENTRRQLPPRSKNNNMEKGEAVQKPVQTEAETKDKGKETTKGEEDTCSNCNKSLNDLTDLGDGIKICEPCYEILAARLKINTTRRRQIPGEKRVCSNCQVNEDSLNDASNWRWKAQSDGTYICFNCHQYSKRHGGADRPLKLENARKVQPPRSRKRKNADTEDKENRRSRRPKSPKNYVLPGAEDVPEFWDDDDGSEYEEPKDKKKRRVEGATAVEGMQSMENLTPALNAKSTEREANISSLPNSTNVQDIAMPTASDSLDFTPAETTTVLNITNASTLRAISSAPGSSAKITPPTPTIATPMRQIVHNLQEQITDLKTLAKSFADNESLCAGVEKEAAKLVAQLDTAERYRHAEQQIVAGKYSVGVKQRLVRSNYEGWARMSGEGK